MPIAEIHDANGNYSGYARFNNAGEFKGTFGGYGRNGNANRNGGSRVQNFERTVGMRQAARLRRNA